MPLSERYDKRRIIHNWIEILESIEAQHPGWMEQWREKQKSESLPLWNPLSWPVNPITGARWFPDVLANLVR